MYSMGFKLVPSNFTENLDIESLGRISMDARTSNNGV